MTGVTPVVYSGVHGEAHTATPHADTRNAPRKATPRAGGIPAARESVQVNGKLLTEQIKVRLEPELHRAVENIAKREQVPVSIIHRRALRQYVEREKGAKTK